MKAGRIFALSIGSGIAAGALLIAMNMFVAGPHIDKMTNIYFDALMSQGDLVEEEFDSSLQSLYFWQAAFPMVMGIAGGALVAIAYVQATGKNAFKVALVVAGVAWFSLFVMPAIKYPYNSDTLYNPEAATSYATLFAAYAAISGLAALGTAIVFARTKRKNWYIGAAGVYLAITAGLFFAFPNYPQSDVVPSAILAAWRSASAAGMTAFWFTLGILAGALLEREEKKGAGRGI
ncbi:MAG: CbtA family protein [Nitrososphaera sp.]